MSSFQGAHDFNIESVVQAQNYIQHVAASSKTPLEQLRDNIAAGALHNSAERCDAPKCHIETRVAIQEEIVSWITHGDTSAQKIMWLTGPAGAGKTAIAGSVAETCKKKGLLAASFFFSAYQGSANRRSKRCLVSTLAYQLTLHDSLGSVGSHIFSRIQRDPAIFERRLEDQMEELILKPLRQFRASMKGSPPVLPKIVIIDGLDECGVDQYQKQGSSRCERKKEDDQVEILSLLAGAVKDPSFPFLILISSRPEPAIRNFFSETITEPVVELFLDDKYNPDADIEFFLRCKFADMRRRYNLPPSWPDKETIQILVTNSSGQFIYAATVVRFMEEPSSPPQAQLDIILKLPIRDAQSNPFGPLDALYTFVVKSSPDPRLSVLWIHTITDRGIAGSLSAFFWRGLLEALPGETDFILGNLSSLLLLPPNDDRQSRFRLYHKSFIDFLDDPHRCGDLYVGTKARREFFIRRYVRILQDQRPAYPVSSQECELFHKEFFQLYVSYSLTLEDRSTDGGLIAANVGWWLRQLCNYKNTRAAQYMWLFWRLVHTHCSWNNCRQSCSHWRRGIRAFCRNEHRVLPSMAARILDGWNIRPLPRPGTTAEDVFGPLPDVQPFNYLRSRGQQVGRVRGRL